MKHIFDAEFHYRPSFDTDVRRTFEKARRQQQRGCEEGSDEAKISPEIKVRVLKLEQLKKATSA